MTALEKIALLNEQRYGLDFDHEKAIRKIGEEFDNEFINAKDEIEMVDALCDIIVICAGELRKLGYDPEMALYETIKEITSRKQDPIQEKEWRQGLREPGAKWMKWKHQPIETLEFADYEMARIED